MAKTVKRKRRSLSAKAPTTQQKGPSRGFPLLGDLIKNIPKGGLLDPSLRKGVTGKLPTAKDVLGKNPYARR